MGRTSGVDAGLTVIDNDANSTSNAFTNIHYASSLLPLLQWMEPVAGEAAAVVIAGDLNAPPDEPTHALLAK